jgi:hypothetical protein
MDINYHLLRSGLGDKLVKQLSAALHKKFKKNIGKVKKGESIGYFRFHVSGDVFSDEYFKTMCEVARKCKNVKFWTYTKQYAILERNKGSIPSNLTVIVSCWGKYRPKNIKKRDGKVLTEADGSAETYANLEKEFPLAYLDDGTDATKGYIDEETEPFTCPCTDYSDMEVHCDRCLRCVQTKGEHRNIVFNKH